MLSRVGCNNRNVTEIEPAVVLVAQRDSKDVVTNLIDS